MLAVLKWKQVIFFTLAFPSVINVGCLDSVSNMAAARNLATIQRKATMRIPIGPRDSDVSAGKDRVNTWLY